MGLTHTSTGFSMLKHAHTGKEGAIRAALAGNPNVGKSSIFNALTGMNQHTGNWTGKTVETAAGYCERQDICFIDLPGTYSLRSGSPEENAARDYIRSGEADAVVVVCDALSMVRGLALALQIMELTPHTVLCVNFMDTAKKYGRIPDLAALSERLGIPVVGTSAKDREGLDALCEAIRKAAVSEGHPVPMRYPPKIEDVLETVQDRPRGAVIAEWLDAPPSFVTDRESFRAMLFHRPILTAEAIMSGIVTEDIPEQNIHSRIDRVMTHPFLSVPIMLFGLSFVLWLTIVGSNVPSSLLSDMFDGLEARLYGIAAGTLPVWLCDMLISGVLRTLFRVVAVMLPPMAIFFPLFTLLEDIGVLGRIAFNLDGVFERCRTCGKQALTMCMSLGCNAAGVVGCRIIDSPRERLIAILTASFMPCNGRFPILIAAASLLCAGQMGAALLVTGLILLGFLAALGVSWLLSRTFLSGVDSHFVLELPPYRMPHIGQVIVRSVFDRTLYVLGRAIVVAAPAGLLIWLLANISIGGESLLFHLSGALDPVGRFFGLDGVILCAFLLAFPANELVLPLILMGYTSASVMGGGDLAGILASGGWSTLTYVNMLILTMFHMPCSTTLLSIKKETGSLSLTLAAAVIPGILGLSLCALSRAIFLIV